MKAIDVLVSRFLVWPVPAEVHPDGTPGQPGRTGTNLLTAEQARMMLEHVLGSVEAPVTPDFCLKYPAVAAVMLNTLLNQVGAQSSPAAAPAEPPPTFGPEPAEPVSEVEQRMLDQIAVTTDLNAFPSIVTSIVTDLSTTPPTREIRDNDGKPLTRIHRAMLRRIWTLQGRTTIPA